MQIEKTDQQSKADYEDDDDDDVNEIDDGSIDGCEKKDNDEEEDDGVRGPYSLSFIM